MTEDQRRDLENRKRVEQIAKGYDRFTSRVGRILFCLVGAMGVLAITCAIALNTSHHQIKQVRATAAISKQTAAVSKATADRLAAVVKQIQAERERNTLNSCRETNARHDKTVARFRKLARDADQAQVAATITLIDALSPHRDCGALVRRQVKGSRP